MSAPDDRGLETRSDLVERLFPGWLVGLDAMARLMLEELPTGKVGDWNRHREPVTPEDAARHRAELAAAIHPRNNHHRRSAA